jgi:hypothetical protein
MSYQISDEPIETPWRAYVVNPGAPLLAEMLCGSWLSLPWFAFNAWAMGSPTKRKEIALCLASLAGTIVMGMIWVWLVRSKTIENRTIIQLLLLVIVTWKLGMAYVIDIVQSRTFHVYEYYGGPVRSSTYVIATGFILRDFVIGLFDDPLWVIIVMGDALGVLFS